MELKGKQVLVAGTGVSGIAAAKLLLRLGADTILYDSNEKLCKEDIRAKADALKEVPVVLGALDTDLIRQLDLAVLSPGVPLDQPVVRRLADAGVPLWGEIELAYRCAKGRLAAITGTNGKTTTTALVGEDRKSVV